MFCDKCGKELAPGSIFCPNCGAKQLEEEPSAEMSASSSVSPVREAPSSQPSNQQSAERTTSPKHVTDESVYRKIICNNADYYLSQFQNILYGEKNKMNWASFFLSLYHAAYRGVWREWLRAVMWSLLIAIGSGLIASATIGYYPGVAIFFAVIAICGGIWWIIANILFAKNFNRVYLEHVEKKIAQQDFTPDPSGGRVVASISAYAAGYTMVGIIIGALSVGSLMTGIDDSTYDDMDNYTDYTPSDDVDDSAFAEIPDTEPENDAPAATAPGSTEPSGSIGAAVGLSEAQINAITYRIYEENEFGASIAIQGQIMNRQNWRNYEQALLDTLVDRIGNYDMSGIDPNYTAEQKLAAWMTVLPNDPNTGVITCQISRASFEQWMAANYDVDTSIAPQSGIYDSNDQCIIHGSQGYIEDDINVYNIHSIDDSTFYVQFEKTSPTDSTSDGYGYAVVHMDNLDDQHFTIWELGWDTESISEQSLAAYKN